MHNNKYIYVKLLDGSLWKTSADVIADNRAAYYADKENDSDSWDSVYNEEFAYTMSDDFEITDWFYNNMNNDDVEWELIRQDEKLTPLNSQHVEYNVVEEKHEY